MYAADLTDAFDVLFSVLGSTPAAFEFSKRTGPADPVGGLVIVVHAWQGNPEHQNLISGSASCKWEGLEGRGSSNQPHSRLQIFHGWLSHGHCSLDYTQIVLNKLQIPTPSNQGCRYCIPQHHLCQHPAQRRTLCIGMTLLQAAREPTTLTTTQGTLAAVMKPAAQPLPQQRKYLTAPREIMRRLADNTDHGCVAPLPTQANR